MRASFYKWSKTSFQTQGWETQLKIEIWDYSQTCDTVGKENNVKTVFLHYWLCSSGTNSIWGEKPGMKPHLCHLPFFFHLNFLILVCEGQVWTHLSMVFVNFPDSHSLQASEHRHSIKFRGPQGPNICLLAGSVLALWSPTLCQESQRQTIVINMPNKFSICWRSLSRTPRDPYSGL